MRLLTKLPVAVAVLLLAATSPSAQQPQPLAFGVLNQQSPALTAERWNPILHYAGAVSGVPLQLKMGRTVQDTNAMMARGEFDFVFTNHNFQSEFDTIGFKVIARWAGEPIRAVIAVPADSPIQHLRELDGKRVSFPSTDAFVGYAVPLVALKRAGVNVEQMFGGNQEGTLAQVKAKRVEAGAVNSRFLTQYAEREHVQFREIYVSEGFPDLAVIAHPRVPAATVERVRRALLGMTGDPERGARPDRGQVQGLRAGGRTRLRRRPPRLSSDRPVKSSLRTLLLGLSSVAIVVVTLSGLAVNLRDRSNAARVRLSEQTERLATAAGPLLLDSLVVGDLARAEQTLRNLNADSVWSLVTLYEADGKRLIFDASPEGGLRRSGAPRWVKHLVPLTLEEHRVSISAPPVVYGILAVTPSVQSLEIELWAEIRTMIAVTGVLLVTLLGLTHVILLVGLRPVRALAESATRLGSGDLATRMPETRLSEMAPTGAPSTRWRPASSRPCTTPAPARPGSRASSRSAATSPGCRELDSLLGASPTRAAASSTPTGWASAWWMATSWSSRARSTAGPACRSGRASRSARASPAASRAPGGPCCSGTPPTIPTWTPSTRHRCGARATAGSSRCRPRSATAWSAC